MFCPILFVLIVACIIASCSSSKNIANDDRELVAIVVPCSESGLSDSNFFRASASAVSSNVNLARDKAIASARTQLAKNIVEKTIIAASRYSDENGVDDRSAFIKSVEGIVNNVIEQNLADCVVICENYSESNGKYTVYVGVEVPSSTIITGLKKALVNSITNFDGDAFEKFFLNGNK